MRATVFALLLATPISAFAQTAGDLVRQQWPLAVPAAVGTPPASPSVFGGFDHDVSREVWLRGAPLATGLAPRTPVATGAFMSADLARLRNDPARPLAAQQPAGYLTALAH